MSFNVSGIASGLDWKTMVDQLMNIERQPITRLQDRKKTLQTKNSAFQDINTKLLTLQNAVGELSKTTNIKARKATVTKTNTTDADAITITANTDAAPGVYKVKVNALATNTTVSNTARLGSAITRTDIALNDLNFAQDITAGTFSLMVNGEAKTIEIDPATDTLSNLFTKINGADGRITASLENNKLVLTADPSVTSFSVGTGGDKSNFASVASLSTASFSGGKIESLREISTVQLSKAIYNTEFDNAGISGLNGPTSGVLTINGAEFSYDTATETLGTLIGRINASDANVTASYNAIDDKIMLASKVTGATGIAISDTGGLLSNSGLFSTQTLGANASITVEGFNGGQPITSTSNTFTNVAPGLSITATTEMANWQTVSITADTEGVKGKVKAFVDEFNKIVDTIDAARAKGQTLAYDGTLGDIRAKLFSMVSSAVDTLSNSPKTFSAIGITTSKDDRNHLTLDEKKFTEALESDPNRVADIFTSKVSTYNADGTVDKTKYYGIAARINEYLTTIRSTDGVFKVFDKSTSSQIKMLDNNIKNLEVRMLQKKTQLTAKFTAMEKAVSTMNSQQSAMLSQLSSLSS